MHQTGLEHGHWRANSRQSGGAAAAGNRAFLFVVDGPEGRFSWFYQNSASADDLQVPIVVGGANYGAPLENLRSALKAEGLESVDLWIGSRGLPVAQLVVPVLKPKAYLPVHWDGLWGAFEAGVPQPFSDPALETFLQKSGVQVIKPLQYMDRLDRNGIRSVPNATRRRSDFEGGRDEKLSSRWLDGSIGGRRHSECTGTA